MRACTYRSRVTLQSVSQSTADSYGARTEVWSDVATSIPAEVQTTATSEIVKGVLVKGEASMQVKMRYRNDVTQTCRFKWGSRSLYVQSVDPDSRNRELTCICRETLT
jgi:SPP1 family predicted phage head-tail adaptor